MLMKVRWIALLLFSVVVTPPLMAEQDGFEEAYDEAMRMYRTGDVITAIQKAEGPAESGHIPSIMLIGEIYEIAAEDDLSEKYYKQAVDLGNGEAAYKLVVMFTGSQNKDYGPKKVLELLGFAVRKKYSPAFVRMSSFYEKGEMGLKKDNKKALTWLLAAAKLDNVNSMRLIGYAYRQGSLGLRLDAEKSREWFAKAGQAAEKAAEKAK